MKLICNLSMLGRHPTGLGVYAEHCVSGLAQRFRLGLIAGNGYLPDGEVVVKAPDSVAIGSGKLAALRRQWWLRSVQFNSDQVMYSPTHHGLPNQVGQIITVHDLISLRFPAQHFSQYLFFRFGLPHLLKKCRAVFTVSETTRHDIAKTYAFPLESIFVVPNGVDQSAFPPASGAHSGSRFLLMVGARYPHKNVHEVLDMAPCWQENYRLIITSCDGPYRKALAQKVRHLGLDDRVEFKDYVSREALLYLYQSASALVYPSCWEGFGIPPLEALSCGTPVIASDIPPHREVLGDAAFFVKLGDPQSWAEAFRLLSLPEKVNNCMEMGQMRLSKFTWENALKALESALLNVEPRLEECRL
ncbi:MAG: glycosyltransferase family 4 protein [Azoarcus sp.]|jgi:glycosyltransferase involved in cell wall biosynthesis|nr:glycosyltransferase family 4 protein [Azoarcus sp.]